MKGMVRNRKSLMFSFATLALSWGFTLLLFQGTDQASSLFGLVMFIPLLAALVFRRLPAFRLQEPVPVYSKRLRPRHVLLGAVLPLVLVGAAAAIDLVSGISTVDHQLAGDGAGHIRALILILPSMISAFGEEFGWRGYLLPSLTETCGKLQATLWTSLVWILFHMPVVFLLARSEGVSSPALVMLVQAGAVFFVTFAFSYVFFRSRHVLPVVVFHAVWNVFNPYLLGDYYTNDPGILQGRILVQNGEGVVGMIVLAAASVYFIRWLRRAE